MTKLTNTIEIEASPEKVFDLRNATIKNMNEASKGLAEVEMTSKGPIGVGQQCTLLGAAGGSTAEMDLEVTEFVKNKKFAHAYYRSKQNQDGILIYFRTHSQGNQSDI